MTTLTQRLAALQRDLQVPALPDCKVSFHFAHSATTQPTSLAYSRLTNHSIHRHSSHHKFRSYYWRCWPPPSRTSLRCSPKPALRHAGRGNSTHSSYPAPPRLLSFVVLFTGGRVRKRGSRPVKWCNGNRGVPVDVEQICQGELISDSVSLCRSPSFSIVPLP